MNRFHITIIIRITLICLTCFAFIYILKETNRPATSVFFLLLIVFQAIWLIYFVNRTNRELSKFIIHLKEKDTSFNFSKKIIEKNFKGLITHLEEINQEIQKSEIEKIRKQHYMNVIVEHIAIGLLSFKESGEIELINPALIDLLGITKINHINQLNKKYEGLSEIIKKLKSQEQKLIRLENSGTILLLAIKATTIIQDEEIIKIVSFQNIKNELDEKELESWQKLIRLLRHEIMNSITPITTLTTVIKRRFNKANQRKSFQEITEEDIDDTLLSAEAIEERSNGLITFINNFKSLNNLPKLSTTTINLYEFFNKVALLFREQFILHEIQLEISINPIDLKLIADVNLFEQLIINLIKNAFEAIKSTGKIQISAKMNIKNEVVIQIIDNGCGMPENVLENIFLPFFTTKENGSGIGLSLARQIMRMHGGTITVQSEPNKETIFTLKF